MTGPFPPPPGAADTSAPGAAAAPEGAASPPTLSGHGQIPPQPGTGAVYGTGTAHGTLYGQRPATPPGTVYGAPAQRQPVPLPPAPATDRPAPEPPRDGPLLRSIGAAAVAAVVAVLIFVVRTLTAAPAQPSAGPVLPIAAAPTVTAAPFDGTPAAPFARAPDGIILPAANAVPGFTAAQVAADLQKVKQAMVAARLDTTMLVQHNPSTLLGLLAADARPGLAKHFDTKDFFVYATELAAGQTLTADPVRVKGRVTFAAASDDDVRSLQVVTNFVWVYPFSGPQVAPGDRLVVVHDEITWGFPVDGDVTKNSRGLWIYSARGFASNMDCSLLHQGLLALGRTVAARSGGPTDGGTAFDPSGPLTVTDGC